MKIDYCFKLREIPVFCVLVLMCCCFSWHVQAKQVTPIKECLSFSVYKGLADFYKGYPNIAEPDENGVIHYLKGDQIRRHHPSLISRWGLSALKAYCENGDIHALQAAYQQAIFLLKKSSKINGFYTWKFEFVGSGTPPGWSSGIANGAIIDLFLHLGWILDDQELIDSAKMGAISFTKQISDEGLVFEMPNDSGVFWEEYASLDAKVPHVLNGHILAMMHVYSYLSNYESIFHKDAHHRVLSAYFNQAIDVVRNYMDDFDAYSSVYGCTTWYDLGHIRIKPPKAYPHRIHWNGLIWLYTITGEKAFRSKGLLWKKIYMGDESECKRNIEK